VEVIIDSNEVCMLICACACGFACVFSGGVVVVVCGSSGFLR
jgi:hypothetical protein